MSPGNATGRLQFAASGPGLDDERGGLQPHIRFHGVVCRSRFCERALYGSVDLVDAALSRGPPQSRALNPTEWPKTWPFWLATPRCSRARKGVPSVRRLGCGTGTGSPKAADWLLDPSEMQRLPLTRAVMTGDRYRALARRAAGDGPRHRPVRLSRNKKRPPPGGRPFFPSGSDGGPWGQPRRGAARVAGAGRPSANSSAAASTATAVPTMTWA